MISVWHHIVSLVRKYPRRGFTLIEVLVGTFLFLIVSVGIFQGYIKVFDLVRASRWKGTAVLLANEQFEIMRNLPYRDVGTQSSIPPGKLSHVQTLVRDQATFIATTTIRNVDDPFDGSIGSTTNDTSPADYKIAEIEIACTSCKSFVPIILNAHIAPKNLETASTNGALFVKVFDANGQPISDANIHIDNGTTTPAVVIDDVTNTSGLLQVVDVPPGTDKYRVIVSKTGYSTDRTYPRGGSTPTPVKPDATVLLQQLTQISFAIDRTSTMNVATVDVSCSPISSAAFSLTGAKLISTPSVPKYTQNLVTSSGVRTISNLEWDTYTIAMNDATYELAGIIPLLPISLAPNASQDVRLILAPKNPSSYLVTIKDGGSGLPISGATVALGRAGATTTLTTGQGYLRQTDWSGGSGQVTYTNETQYFSSDGNVDVTSSAGQAKLKTVFGQYVSDGILTSSTFDTGTSSNFYQISWLPQSQPAQSGPDAVKIQLATAETNDASTTWSYSGPDGTASSYYTVSNLNIAGTLSGNRYLRYKLFLHSNSTTTSPTVSDISFTYSTACTAPGQVYFSGLTSGTYTLSATKSGYQSYLGSVSVGSSWSTNSVSLFP